MKKPIIILFFAIFINSLTAVSQNCAEKKVQYGKCKEPFDLSYEDTGKSLSFPVAKGKTQKIVITLAGKKDYYFAVCSESDDELNFKIRNGNNPDEIIFDNSGFEHPQFVEFSMLFSNKLVFEITVPLTMGSDNSNKTECVGMLLFQKDN